MNNASLRKAPWALPAAVLLCAAGGFALGVSGPDARDADDGEPSAVMGSGLFRESGTPLRILGEGGHWGAYDAPEAQAPAPTVAAVPDLEGIARDYRLVGIEHRSDGSVALLLPVADSSAGAEVIRLKAGDPLADGITLDSIGSDSVGFSTAAGTSTLHLYDGAKP